ncbi:MAG: hypothetical protein ACO216_10305 [Vulcanococcus sp.]
MIESMTSLTLIEDRHAEMIGGGRYWRQPLIELDFEQDNDNDVTVDIKSKAYKGGFSAVGNNIEVSQLNSIGYFGA